MLMALVRGKLSRGIEGMEDILTSNVFGTLKYQPIAHLTALLGECIEETGSPLGLDTFCQEQEFISVQWEFWPWLDYSPGASCEPDLLVTLESVSGTRTRVMIEAKYRSPKSSEADYTEAYEFAPKDQLARQWSNLVSMPEEAQQNILVYLTNDQLFPRDDIQAAQEELKRKALGEAHIVWLPWAKIHDLFRGSSNEALHDIALGLERLGLIYYDGIQVPTVDLDWQFESILDFDWCWPTTAVRWTFR